MKVQLSFLSQDSNANAFNLHLKACVTSPYEWVNPSLLQKSKSLKLYFETCNMKQHQAFVEIVS